MNTGPDGTRSPTVPVTTRVARPPTIRGRARRRSPIAPPTSSRIADATAPRSTYASRLGRSRMAACTVDSDGPQTFGSRPAANSANAPARSVVRACRSSKTSARTLGSGGRGIPRGCYRPPIPPKRAGRRARLGQLDLVDERLPARRGIVARGRRLDRHGPLLGAADERELERQARVAEQRRGGRRCRARACRPPRPAGRLPGSPAASAGPPSSTPRDEHALALRQADGPAQPPRDVRRGDRDPEPRRLVRLAATEGVDPGLEPIVGRQGEVEALADPVGAQARPARRRRRAAGSRTIRGRAARCARASRRCGGRRVRGTPARPTTRSRTRPGRRPRTSRRPRTRRTRW